MEKTCGNCGHGCYESTVYCEVSNCDMLVNCEACDDWIDPKRQHIRCDKITRLEQRYQQLAEVARDLYKAVEPMHESCNEDTCLNLIDEGWPSDACLYDFRKQIEELGVEL